MHNWIMTDDIKQCPLEKQLGKKFESNQTTVAVSENEIVQTEISYYSYFSAFRMVSTAENIVSAKRAAVLLEMWKNLFSCMKIYNLINNYL